MVNDDPLAMRERESADPIRLERPDWLRRDIANANAAQIRDAFDRLEKQFGAIMETALLLHQLLDATGHSSRPGTAREFLPGFERLLEVIRWLDGDRVLRELEIDRETDRLIPHAGKILQGIRRAILVEGPVPEHHRQIMARHREEWPALWTWLDRLPR